MQGIAEQDEARDVAEAVLGGHLRRNPPSHRFASDKERALPAPSLTNRFGDGSPCRLEHVVSVRDTASCVRVKEIECDDVETSPQEGMNHPHHPGMCLPPACPVRQYERGTRFLGRVKERRAGSPLSYTKVEVLSLHDTMRLLRHGKRR